MPRTSLLAATVVTLCIASSCRLFDPNYEAQTNKIGDIRLVVDSTRVRSLISQQDALGPGENEAVHRFFNDEHRLSAQNNRDELHRILTHPEIYIPDRITFLDAMAMEPTTTVQRGSFCRILQRSRAICSRHPQENPSFVRVRVTSGKEKGVEGWGCLGDGIGLTVAW